MKNKTITKPPYPNFKHTELGWIPKDWEVKIFGDVISGNGKYGINAAAVEYDKTLPRYLRITDFDEEGNIDETKKVSVKHKDSSDFILQKNDVLFARTGASVGKSFLLQNDNDKYVYAGFLIKYSLDLNKIVPYYFFNLTRTQKYNYWVKVISVRSGQPGINNTEYKQYKFPLPPLAEQKAIADCLSTWDDAITKQQQLINAKQKQHKGLRQLLLTGKKRLTNPETGKVFDGDWEEKRLGEIIEICSSKRVLKKYWKNKGIPFYRTREIISLSYNQNFRTPIYIDRELFEELKEKYGVPKPKDILATGVGTIGELYRVNKADKFYFKDGNVLWFKMNKKLSTDFLFHSFKTRYLKKQLFDNASITTVATFEKYGLKFGVLYIFPAIKKPVVCVKDYDDILKDSCIYYRYNSLSCEIKSSELIDLISLEKERESKKWMELFSKISTVGVDNTAIYNKYSGELTTNNGNRFILNEDLIQRLKVIDKYSIQDEGAEAVKIIGEIDSQGTIIKQPLAINENEILTSYLNSENISAPKSYLEACCYTNTKYLPIYFFILKAELSKSQAKNLFSKVNSRSKVKKELQERIENNSEFENKNFPISENTSVQRKRLTFYNNIINENEFEITNEGEIKRFLESIYSLNNINYNSQFVKNKVLIILENHTQCINGNLGSLFRSTIAFLDVIENKHLIDE